MDGLNKILIFDEYSLFYFFKLIVFLEFTNSEYITNILTKAGNRKNKIGNIKNQSIRFLFLGGSEFAIGTSIDGVFGI